ncbi:hypothetical protein [Armatimonas sp.]|uniref:hypothetical protein n=1 Tax=Armatimonas sp. TaxID=1872638 RepID=UPI0037524DBE
MKRSGSMLAGNINHSLSVLIPCGGALAIALLGGISLLYRSRLHWTRNLMVLGLGRQGTGVYRGRAIQVTRQGSAVTIAIRIRNPARLYDELSSEGVVPGLPWISEIAAMQLNTLAFARRVWDRWHIQLKGETLQISCATVRPERLRFLLDLACDLADGVDRFGEERPVFRLRRRAV